LSTISLRYFNVYGPNQDWDSEYSVVIPKFIKASMEGKPHTIYGDGEQSRDFTYIKDVVDANIIATECDNVGPHNIAGGKRYTINDVSDKVGALAGNSGKDYVPKRQGDVEHTEANLDKAAILGYEPKVKFDEGLSNTFEYMKRKLED